MSIEEARKIVESGIRRGVIVPAYVPKREVSPPKNKNSIAANFQPSEKKKRRSLYGKRGPYKKKERPASKRECPVCKRMILCVGQLMINHREREDARGHGNGAWCKYSETEQKQNALQSAAEGANVATQ